MTHDPINLPNSPTPDDQNHVPPDPLDARSSVFEKLDPDQRRKVDRALIDRDPPTYRAVFKKFNLAAEGLSFTAFYNYARQVRRRAAALRIADLSGHREEDVDVIHALPKLLGDLLIEYLAYPEEASPSAVHRLTQAYKIALAGRKLSAESDLAEARRVNEENRELMQRMRAQALQNVDHLQAISALRRENDRFRRALQSRGLDPDAALKLAEREE